MMQTPRHLKIGLFCRDRYCFRGDGAGARGNAAANPSPLPRLKPMRLHVPLTS